MIPIGQSGGEAFNCKPRASGDDPKDGNVFDYATA